MSLRTLLSLHSAVRFFVEEASLHLISEEEPGDTEIIKSFYRRVLEYLDGKKLTGRYSGAFSFLVGSLKSEGLYLENGHHFLLDNPAYTQVYQMYGGKLDIPAQKSNPFPQLTNILSRFPHLGTIPPTKEYLYDHFEDEAVFHAGAFLPGKMMDQRQYLPFQDALIHAGIGARMDIDVMDAEMTEERLREIVTYLEDIKVDDLYSEFLIERCTPLLDSVVVLADDFLIDLDLLKRIARLLHLEDLLLEIDRAHDAFRFTHLNRDIIAQVVGLPINEHWVTDEVISKIFARFLNGKYDATKAAYDFNEQTIGYLIERLKMVYTPDQVHVAIAGGSHTDARDYSPINILVFNEGPEVYAVPINKIENFINPYTNQPLSNDYVVALKWRYDVAQISGLFSPAPIAEYAQIVKLPTVSIFKALNNEEILSEYDL